jgi:hypothetical protein
MTKAKLPARLSRWPLTAEFDLVAVGALQGASEGASLVARWLEARRERTDAGKKGRGS